MMFCSQTNVEKNKNDLALTEKIQVFWAPLKTHIIIIFTKENIKKKKNFSLNELFYKNTEY